MTPRIKGYDQNIHPLLIILLQLRLGEYVSLSKNLEERRPLFNAATKITQQ